MATGPVPQHFTAPFGVVLRQLRKERGLKQIELAVEVAVDHSLISRWETGGVLPTSKDVQHIAAVLGLTQDEAEELRYAWRRDHECLLPGEVDAPVLRSADDWIESLQVSIDCVRALRKAGQPRMALMLGRRDARLAFDRLRAQSWTPGHSHALVELSELLLEECKAGLDYIPSEAVRGGELDRALKLQRLASQSTDSGTAEVFHLIAREGVTYVAGNIGEAHNLSISLLANHRIIPAEWLPEIVRACGINAGKLGDRSALERTEKELKSLIEERDDLAAGTHAFILEGVARGWSTIEPHQAEKVIEQAWSVREKSADSEAHSSLRYVQLVRSQSEIVLVTRSREDLDGILGKINSALEISMREGYDKYIQELKRLGERLD